MSKIVEVTGVPCAGKSNYIRKFFSNKTIINGYYINTASSYRRIFYSLIRLPKILVKNTLSLKSFYWLVRQSWKYEESTLFRLNALRNSLLKFSLDDRDTLNGAIVIDEGISHIPFVLQLPKDKIYQFIELFADWFQNRQIIFLSPPSSKALHKRLIDRGHGRANTPDAINRLVEENLRVSDQYRQALVKSNLDVRFVE